MAKRKSRPSQSDILSPKAVPWRGGLADLRAADGDNGREGGAKRAVLWEQRDFSGGTPTGESGVKSRTHGHIREPRTSRRRDFRQQPGLFQTVPAENGAFGWAKRPVRRVQ